MLAEAPTYKAPPAPWVNIQIHLPFSRLITTDCVLCRNLSTQVWGNNAGSMLATWKCKIIYCRGRNLLNIRGSSRILIRLFLSALFGGMGDPRSPRGCLCLIYWKFWIRPQNSKLSHPRPLSKSIHLCFECEAKNLILLLFHLNL